MLKINEIFQSIQTEGPLADTPATFIRLSGCNLSCDFCDTEHEKVNQLIAQKELVDHICVMGDTELIVITGGEPFLQDFSELVHGLLSAGYYVQVETNGSVKPHENFNSRMLNMMIIVCSPKTGIHEDMWPLLHSIKLLCSSSTKEAQISTLRATCKREGIELFLQPTMGGSKEEESANIARTVELCIATNCKFSLQYHKLIGIL